MGWLVSLCLVIGACVTKEPIIFVAAGLFAVAGSISMIK